MAEVRVAETVQADYLTEVCALLWPQPARTRIGPRASARGRRQSELIVLPSRRSPRLLVPPGRRAAAAAMRGYGQGGSARTRLATQALTLLLASGLGGMVLRDRLVIEGPGHGALIETYLSDALGEPVVISMHLTAPRANRKPVLQVLTPAGMTVAYVKLGVNDLTRTLVGAEREALARLATVGLTRLQAPRVLSSGRWRDNEVLILAALPVRARRTPLRPGQLAGAMAELASSMPVRRAPLATSRFWQQLLARLDAAPDGAERAALRAALDQLARREGDQVLRFGAWHGDWTPWNMASTPGGLLVWDWERFAAEVPFGFDALHYWLQARVVPGHHDPLQAAAECVRRAAELVGPVGVAAREARLTALAYLAELSVRYLADRQEQAGARLGSPGRWLIPAISAAIGQQ